MSTAYVCYMGEEQMIMLYLVLCPPDPPNYQLIKKSGDSQLSLEDQDHIQVILEAITRDRPYSLIRWLRERAKAAALVTQITRQLNRVPSIAFAKPDWLRVLATYLQSR